MTSRPVDVGAGWRWVRRAVPIAAGAVALWLLVAPADDDATGSLGREPVQQVAVHGDSDDVRGRFR